MKKNIFNFLNAIIIILIVLLVFAACSKLFVSSKDSVFESESVIQSIIDTENSSEESLQEESDSSNEEVDFTTLKMVAIGDSILSGAGIDYPVTVALKDILGLASCENYGVPGSALSDVSGLNPYIYRYESMPDDADIVLVQCSGNDIGKNPVGNINDTDPKTFWGALKILGNGLREKYPDAFIFFQPGFYRHSDYTEVATPYMEAMKEYCRIYGFAYFDTFTEEFPYDYKVNTVDWVHLNQDYTDNVYAPYLAEFIRTNYK